MGGIISIEEHLEAMDIMKRKLAETRSALDFLQGRYDANTPYIAGLETRVKAAEQQRDEARAWANKNFKVAVERKQEHDRLREDLDTERDMRATLGATHKMLEESLNRTVEQHDRLQKALEFIHTSTKGEPCLVCQAIHGFAYKAFTDREVK